MGAEAFYAGAHRSDCFFLSNIATEPFFSLQTLRSFEGNKGNNGSHTAILLPEKQVRVDYTLLFPGQFLLILHQVTDLFFENR